MFRGVGWVVTYCFSLCGFCLTGTSEVSMVGGGEEGGGEEGGGEEGGGEGGESTVTIGTMTSLEPVNNK